MTAERGLPALFIGHGSPMNAVEDNEFRRGWADVARGLPRPEAVLCVSAHWETTGVSVTAAERPVTIHDFFGFPDELFAIRYPAPGSPALARTIAGMLGDAGQSGTGDVQVALDGERGLDHGAWSVLLAMYPDADVPVVQLGLDTSRPASFHYALARELAPLRRDGVLILGSGDIVHNLRVMDYRRPDGYDWAVRFDDEVRRRILARDHDALVDYPALGHDARLAVPTPEHYLPLLYVLAVRGAGDEVTFFNDRVVMGSVSMTSLAISSNPGNCLDRTQTA
jgi:4,5-DOPA dioxygenase extradiol